MELKNRIEFARRLLKSKHLVALITCGGLAQLLMFHQFYYLKSPINRFFLIWNGEMAWLYLFNLLFMSLLFWSFYLSIPKSFQVGLRLNILQGCLILVFFSAALSASRVVLDSLFLEALWVLAVALVFFYIYRPYVWILGAIKVICMIFFLIALTVAYEMFSWPEWVSQPSTVHTEFKKETTAGVPVYIFVLDEWSFHRSIKNGKFLPVFKNLNLLLERAIFFEQAYAGGSSTELTLPRMLFQSRKEIIYLDGNAQTLLVDPSTGQSRPTRQAESIFNDFRNDGYRTAMVGFYLPYERILGEQVDFVRSYRHNPYDGSFWQKWKSTFLNSSSYWVDPVALIFWRQLYRKNFSLHWLNLNRQMVDLSLKLVESLPEKSIIFNHWPIPHAPYIFNPAGSYHGAFTGERMSGSLEEYNRHLRYLDFLLGRVLKRLKELKRFDQALIVFTSDHNWKRDPTYNYQKNPKELMRVPLIVKWPHQNRPVTINKTVFLNHFLPLLLLARNPENQLEQAVNFIETTDLDWQ